MMKYAAIALSNDELLLASAMIAHESALDNILADGATKEEMETAAKGIGEWYAAYPRIVGNYLSFGKTAEMVDYVAGVLADGDSAELWQVEGYDDKARYAELLKVATALAERVRSA